MHDSFNLIRCVDEKRVAEYASQQFEGCHFLLIQFRQIGDVLLFLPMAKAIKQLVKSSKVSFFTEPVCAELVRHCPYVDQVIVRQGPESLSSTYHTLKQLRSQKIDIVLDGLKTPSSGWYSLLSGAPVRVAMDHPMRRYFYSRTLLPQLECGYTLDEKLLLLAALGINPFQGDFRKIAIEPDEQSIRRVDTFISSLHVVDKFLIAIDPTSKRPTRRWPRRHFSRLVELISEQYPCKAVILWGPGEREIAEEVCANCNADCTIFMESSLLELLYFINRSDLFIGTDSAPRHLAVSQHTPSIAIHGSTGVEAWTPPIPEHLGLSAQLACQPCNSSDCETLACLEELTPESIIDQVLHHISLFVKDNA